MRIATDAFGNAPGSSLAENTNGTSKAKDPFDGIDMPALLRNGQLSASLGGPSSPMRSWTGDGEIMSDSDPAGRVYANEYEYQNHDNSNGLLTTPEITSDDLTMQRVVITGKRLDPQAQEDWYKYQMRTSMPDFGRAAPTSKRANKQNVSKAKAKIDLSNPLLNGGITNGLRNLQAMTPSQVYELRNSGTPIPDTKRTKTDAIEAAFDFSRPLLYALGPNEDSAISAAINIGMPFLQKPPF